MLTTPCSAHMPTTTLPSAPRVPAAVDDHPTIWIASLPCVHTPLDHRLHASDTKGVQQDQKAPRRARLPPLLSLRRGRLRKRRAEGMGSSAAVRAIRTGPKFSTAAYPRPVLVDSGHPCPWTGGAWREPSRRVCSFLRKSKRLTGALPIWRCNASRAKKPPGVPCATRCARAAQS